MALKDDVVTGVVVAGAAWYFFKFMRDQAINTVADLIPALSPPGFSEVQKALVETEIIPVPGHPDQFNSGQLDWMLGQSGGTYAIQHDDPNIYMVLDSGEWSQSGISKSEMINQSRAYIESKTGTSSTWHSWLW